MLFLLKRLFIFVTFIFFLHVFFFLKPSLYKTISSFVLHTLKTVIGYKPGFWIIYILLCAIFVWNLLGNIPLSRIPSLFYSQTLTISLLFWSPIIVVVYITQLKSFILHILPYGAPISLIFFLPLIEIFSQLIRPFTLIIRLSTNISRGHIILYIFSYFTLGSDLLSPFILPMLTFLYFLEIFISILQAYIFVTLIMLYLEETHH